jgi:hypothetical protein
VDLPAGEQIVIGLKAAVRRGAKPGEPIKLHFVQRHVASKQIVGGVALEVRVLPPNMNDDGARRKRR